MPTATILAWLINGCYIYMKTWSQSCHSFHAVNALESPKLSKRTTPKAPRLCTYIGSSLDQRTTESSEANKGCIQYTSWGVPVALFLTTLLELPDYYCVKTKAYSYALYVYMSAQPLPIGASGMGIDVTKITLLPWKLLYLAGKVWFQGLI